MSEKSSRQVKGGDEGTIASKSLLDFEFEVATKLLQKMGALETLLVVFGIAI